MATLAQTVPGIWETIENLARRLIATGTGRSSAPVSPEDERATRDFIHEALFNNPDAFASDLDVQNMLLVFPARL